MKITQSCPTLWPHGLYSPWNSPGWNTTEGSLSLLQGIFPTQGSIIPPLPSSTDSKSLFFKSVSPLLPWTTFPGGSASKEPACQWRRRKRQSFNPRVGKIPWQRQWLPTPVLCLGNPMDRGTWWAAVHGVAKSWKGLSD